ncbi:hypothetical protein BDW22DRAFT_1483470 [Trametopsis cervina]|nr:hypothetical protein BDW22DRAFT_1483470 [Trametopsis cervina]
MSYGQRDLPSSAQYSLRGIALHTAQPNTIAEMLLDMYTRAHMPEASRTWLITKYIHSEDMDRLRKLSASNLVPVIYRIITDMRSQPSDSYVMSHLGALLFMLSTLSKVGASEFRLANEPWPHKALAKEQMSVICDTVWIHRSVCLDATTAMEAINECVRSVQENLAALEAMYQVAWRSADERVPHALMKVSLYAWAHGGMPIHRRIAAQLLGLSCKRGLDDDIRKALQDESDVIAIIKAASTALADESFMGDDLRNILNILWAVFKVSAVAHRVSKSTDSKARGIIELVLGACQRQACKGDGDALKRDRVFFHVSSVALCVLGYLSVGPTSTSAGDSFGGPHLAHYKKIIGKKNMLPVVGKHVSTLYCMPLTEAGDEPSVNETVSAISNILDFQAGVINRHDPAVSRANIKRIKLTSSNWHHVVKMRLEVLPSDQPDIKTASERILVLWKRYGDALGLGRIGLEPVALGSTTCAWTPCLCHHMNSAHRMKVCKGCYQVYYCTKHCQKSDWKEGHRAVCKPRSGRNSTPIPGT